MKKIVKQSQPTELQQWRADNAGLPENLKYGCGGFPKGAVLNGLLAEQGFLCAYTLLKVSAAKAHVEHLKPQASCTNGEDVAWLFSAARSRASRFWRGSKRELVGGSRIRIATCCEL